MPFDPITEPFRSGVRFSLEHTPEYLRPIPQSGSIQRNQDLSLRVKMNASAPGCREVIDGPSLLTGEMGLADLFKGTVDSPSAQIEYYGWLDGDSSGYLFHSGTFEYSGPATEVRLSLDRACLNKRCIVRCSSGPKIFGPYSTKIELATTEYKILVQKSPGTPPHMNCISIDIESEVEIGADRVKEIVTALSFVCGRRIAIYEMVFLNEAGSPSLIIANPPHIYSLKEYSEASRCPFSNSPFLRQNDAKLWSHVLDLTIAFGKRLPLRNVLINIWFARPLPLGGNLVFYAAAIESLVKYWFKLPDNRLQADRLPHAEFMEVITPIITQLEDLEKANSRWGKVREIIHQSNQYSGSSKLLRLYEIQELTTGAVEKAIRDGRNRFAHGADFSSEEDALLLALTNAGEALLNRLILKLIGYEGKYVDYSTYDFPMRELKEALGGPRGDGKPSI